MARRQPSVIRIAALALVTVLVLIALPFGAVVGAATRPDPRVVLIVGPAGSATPYYRRLADEAAVAASKFTSNVVKVYSPNATWPNVRAALQGASVVVYLGHGNGFPSIYRTALYPPTQNGFGLNPHAGAADSHQYFGEQHIGDQIKLAKDAVVIFSHLCYASGNTEPGLAEGTLGQAQQRVDNYAAGFFRAGAGAVIADAYLAPSYYVTSVLKGARSIDSIWRNAPSRNDHFLRFPSERTRGAIAQMDPDRVDSGFHRSIVLKAKLTSGQVLGNAVRGPGQPEIVLEPTLAGLGVTFGAPDLSTPPTAGSKTSLTLPVAADAAALLPDRLMIGTRWDRLDGGGLGTVVPTTPVSPNPAPSGADPGTTAAAPPPIDLVVPEQAGEVVAPVAATKLAGGGIEVPVAVPATPGLYRLVSTVHQADGVAFDAATQALIPALVVRVTGPLTATYSAPPTATVVAGRSFGLAVTVSNLGRNPWGRAAEIHGVDAAETVPAARATLVARWVDLGGTRVGNLAPAGTSAGSILPAGLRPGASVAVDFWVTAPAEGGEYLLVLDVVDPSTGSLAAAGVPPGIVRVTVIR
ncbi:MAG TPA: hypothetical protein VM427_06970 [Patescibacteria group bacterium]|nr:hypothetical protein [Patescibacteria group bacterium]